MPINEQSFLRAVTQMLFVIDRFAMHRAAQIQLLKQCNHIDRIGVRHRQIVRAQRARHTADTVAAAVASGAVFEVEHVHIADTCAHQAASATQARNACTDYQHRRAALHGGRRQIAAFQVAQTMTARMRRAYPIAAVNGFVRRRTTRKRQCGRDPQNAAPTELQGFTLPHSASKVCTNTWFDKRLTSVGTRAMSGGKLNSAGMPSRLKNFMPSGSANGVL